MNLISPQINDYVCNREWRQEMNIPDYPDPLPVGPWIPSALRAALKRQWQWVGPDPGSAGHRGDHLVME